MPGCWLRVDIVADFRLDQAAGLRRLFGQEQLQVITFVAGCEGVGRSVALANIGVALARLGKGVLIIDENSASDDIASSFGLLARHDLDDVLQGEIQVDQAILHPMHGVQVLPAARAAGKLRRLSSLQQHRLMEAMTSLGHAVDVILVDASMAHPHGFSPFGLASQESVVVLSGNSISITEAYALIKNVSQAFARKHFRILINKVKSVQEAGAIFDNLAEVCHRRGIADLEYAGAIVLDEAMRQSAQAFSPVLMRTPSSPSAIAVREIAMDLQYWQRGHEGLSGGLDQFVHQLIHLSQRFTPSLARV